MFDILVKCERVSSGYDNPLFNPCTRVALCAFLKICPVGAPVLCVCIVGVDLCVVPATADHNKGVGVKGDSTGSGDAVYEIWSRCPLVGSVFKYLAGYRRELAPKHIYVPRVHHHGGSVDPWVEKVQVRRSRRPSPATCVLVAFMSNRRLVMFPIASTDHDITAVVQDKG